MPYPQAHCPNDILSPVSPLESTSRRDPGTLSTFSSLYEVSPYRRTRSFQHPEPPAYTPYVPQRARTVHNNDELHLNPPPVPPTSSIPPPVSPSVYSRPCSPNQYYSPRSSQRFSNSPYARLDTSPRPSKRRPGRLDLSPEWERALPSHESVLLQPPRSTSPYLSGANSRQPSPALSTSSSRLDRPFTPCIPEHLSPEPSPGPPRETPPVREWPLAPTSDGDMSSQQDLSKRELRPGSILRNVIRVVILGLSATAFGLFTHSSAKYHNSITSTATSDALPWPTHISFAPCVPLLAISFFAFMVSFLYLSFSARDYLTRSYPKTWRVILRIILSTLLIVLWIGGLAVFKVLEDRNWMVSIGEASCDMKGQDKTFGTICEQQESAFYLSIVSAALEVVSLAAFAVEKCFGGKKKGEKDSENGWAMTAAGEDQKTMGYS